jgi:hypothetical protein
MERAVPTDVRYFALGQYEPDPVKIYAQYRYAEVPNPCRKYHVSADVDGAEHVVLLALPYLAGLRVAHKVVKSRSLLVRQSAGDQAGKFITIYMSAKVAQKNQLIMDLGAQLGELARLDLARPCPTIPRSRRYQHVFAEEWLDDSMFIYGGFECNPYE